MLPGSDLEGSVLSECALLCLLLTVLVPMVSDSSSFVHLLPYSANASVSIQLSKHDLLKLEGAHMYPRSIH